MPTTITRLDGSTVTLDDERLTELRGTFRGEVVAPGDAGYDEARTGGFNELYAERRPGLVVRCTGTADVIDAVGLAATERLLVAVRGGGHSIAGHSSVDGGLLIDLGAMNGVWVDPDARTVTAQGGATWGDVDREAQAFGLAVPGGIISTTGIGGITLGGGIGWLHRKLGLACDTLRSAQLVTADGRLIRTSADEEPDLFWALRGGGGNFGAVVAIEFELIPMRQVHAGMMLFPIERAREVMQTWREWTSEVPDSVTTSIRIMQFPPMPELPPFLRGRGVVLIDGALVEDAGRAGELLAPLRALGPEMDTFADMAPVGLSRIHMDPEQPMPGMSDSMMLDELTAETVDALVDATGPGSGSPLLLVELRHLGGALGRYAGGALSRFDGEYLYFAAGIPMDPAVVAALETHFAIVGAALAPASSGRHYLNFAERAVDPVAFFGEETCARLRKEKAEVDPLEIFRGNHEIPAV